MSDSTHARIWKPIDGYGQRYRVSNYGEIYSVRAQRLLKPSLYGRYLGVSLSLAGHARKHYVHHLVAAAFLGERPAGLHVLHGDGSRDNNRASNLRYGTQSENMRDSIAHGTHGTASREACVHGHPFDETNTIRRLYTTPSGERAPRRGCRACQNIQQRAYAARKRVAVAA